MKVDSVNHDVLSLMAAGQSGVLHSCPCGSESAFEVVLVKDNKLVILSCPTSAFHS